MRRAPERRRLRLWKFFRWVLEENLPRPAPRQAARAGVRVSFAGRSAVLRGRFGPACLRDALRCSCLAVACGDPGVSCDMGRRPLVRRRLAYWLGVSYRVAGDASPAAATTSSATTVPASIKDCKPSRRAPRVVRWSREAAALPCSDAPCRPSKERRILIDPPPPPCGRVAHPCRRGASPHAIRDTPASELRGTSASTATSYGCPAPAGFPPAVWSPSLSEWPPTTPP